MSEKLTEPQKEINGIVENAVKALNEFASFDQEKIDYIVAKASVAALDHHGSLAKLAVEETKRGVFEDKAEAIKYFVYASDNGIRQADKMLYFIAYGKYNDNSCF